MALKHTKQNLIYTRGMVDEDGTPFGVCRSSNSLSMIEFGHQEIHEGRSFTAYFQNTTAADPADRSGIFIKTPNSTTLLHLVASFSTSLGATYSICEAPTLTANIGTHTAVIYNRYRDSTTVSTAVNNATTPVAGKITTLIEANFAAGSWAAGTVLRTASLVAGTGPKPAGGVSRDTEEYILKANTKYVFVITNTTSSATTHTILLDWYETAL